MTEAILIFPAGMPAGLSYREQAELNGRRVIGASSIADDPARSAYQTWEHLPFLTDPGFEAALREVLARHPVAEVHTPHFVVRRWLVENLGRIAPGVRLAGEDGPDELERAYRALRRRIATVPRGPLDELACDKPPLSALEHAGLVRLVSTVPGMCSEEKMHAVVQVMRRAPLGDIVEIGSWWGRSAALFTWLAHRYDLGRMLCVDPWSRDAMIQGDAFLDSTSVNLDTDEALRMFEINLAPLAGGRLNYLRNRSVDAAAVYAAGSEISTAAFGVTRYEGRIAVLHIDGNHAYEDVVQDEAAWTRHVVPGGWIIFDDYVWAFGDGPKRVADDFIARHAARIELAAPIGASMYVKLKAAANAA